MNKIQSNLIVNEYKENTIHIIPIVINEDYNTAKICINEDIHYFSNFKETVSKFKDAEYIIEHLYIYSAIEDIISPDTKIISII